MTSDVLSDPIAENGRSAGDISEVEPPKNGAVLRDKPPFRAGRILHVSCTGNDKAAPTGLFPLVRAAFEGWA